MQVEEVKLGKVWDDKACKEVPGWAAKALEKGLGRKVEVVNSRPKKGFILKTTIDPLDFDERRVSCRRGSRSS